MGLSYNDAIDKLQNFLDNGISGEALETELKQIISDLDVTDRKANADAKTILYSKYDISDLLNNPNNRMLNNTDAFEFLDIDNNTKSHPRG